MGRSDVHPALQKYPSEKRWYVLYVKSRSEKKVYDRLVKINTEVFLPLIKTVRQWSDRKKHVQVPLFSGYIFVFTDPEDFTKIKMIESVVDFVKHENKYATIREDQIETIRQFIETGLHFTSSSETFSEGEK